MKAYQIILCCCDGGRIGKTWGEWLILDKNKAEAKLLSLVDEHNNKELTRTDKFCLEEREELGRGYLQNWWRLYTLRAKTSTGISRKAVYSLPCPCGRGCKPVK